ncbi:MAG: TetR/AcrR family transcriptional regulator [Anaerolineaceae bacterium]|nr:TetR/AcrR family transcriptional regulator [Anaerolineaceae bacterium]
MNKASTQQIIIEAAIACIEKFGIKKTTTRKIAEEAGTNIAAINYYFQSKDDLIQRALGLSLDHMVEDLTIILDKETQSFDKLLHEWIFYIVAGSLEYPGVFMAHMYGPLIEKTDSPAKTVFQEMLAKLSSKAVLAFPEIPKSHLENALSVMISTFMFTMLAPGFFINRENMTLEEEVNLYTSIFHNMIH